jgi:hypothetical protein
MYWARTNVRSTFYSEDAYGADDNKLMIISSHNNYHHNMFEGFVNMEVNF